MRGAMECIQPNMCFVLPALETAKFVHMWLFLDGEYGGQVYYAKYPYLTENKTQHDF